MSGQTSQRPLVTRRSLLQAAGGGFLFGLTSVGVSFPLRGEEFQSKKQLRLKSADPLNAEPELALLTREWITPNELFYVRNHAPVPAIKPESFRLVVEGMVRKPLSLSLADLAKLPQTSVVATMTCAGNRRSEFNQIKPVGGVQWDAGVIGNAEWAGVALSAVLKQAGVKTGAKHVWFEGLDEIPQGDGHIPFGGSIPLAKAQADTEQAPGALLATAMNQEPLPPEHGFPLRTVVPGYIGARSVKWLGRMVVSDQPSPNHYLAGAYRLVTETTPAAWAAADPLYEFPLNSAIALPAGDASVKPGKIRVRGYALPRGAAGNAIRGVEVSADGGAHWTKAKLAMPARQFCWTLWDAEVAVTPATTGLLVRASDTSGQTQPEQVPWNAKGYMQNSWYKSPVKVSG